jgi:hypothetical protein
MLFTGNLEFLSPAAFPGGKENRPKAYKVVK